ncbi:MAG: hypothetical protein KatS3mg015_1429 [Fimbriimonadales bacterium]|nr:MAG: hypothetical protein KatS3mg015_1429 [Fimbriimonadales bacterium]
MRLWNLLRAKIGFVQRRTPLLLAVLFSLFLGCAQTQPPDVYGLWRTKTDEGRIVLLELRSDGTYVRTASLDDVTFVSKGKWRIENRQIVFQEEREQVGPYSGDSQARIEVPFDVQQGALVLKPGTEFEERYLLIQ